MCLNAIVAAPVSTIILSTVTSNFVRSVQDRAGQMPKFMIACCVYFLTMATQAARELIPDAILRRAVSFFVVELYERAFDTIENQETQSTASVADILYTIRLVASRAAELCVYFVGEYIYLCAYLLTYSAYLFTLDVQYGAVCFAFVSLIVLLSIPIVGLLCSKYVLYLTSERDAMTIAESSFANVFTLIALGARGESSQTIRTAADKLDNRGKQYVTTQIILFTCWYAVIVVFYTVGLLLVWKSKRLPSSRINAIVFSLLLLLNYIASTSDRMKRNAWRFAAVFDGVATTLFNRSEDFKRQQLLARFPSGSTSSAVRIDNVSHTYAGASVPALTTLSLEAKEREFVVVRGRSGCGKSTLLKLCAKLVHCVSGDVTVGGVSMRTIQPTEWRSRVLYVSQKLSVFKGSVYENLIFASGITAPPQHEIDMFLKTNRLDHVLRNIGSDIGPAATTGGEGSLSGGMIKIIIVVRAALRCMNQEQVTRHFPQCTRTSPPPLLLLMDEPLAGLDPRTRIAVKHLILKYCNEMTKLCVVHSDDLDDVATSRWDLTPS